MTEITYLFLIDHDIKEYSKWQFNPILVRRHIPYKRLIKIPKTSKCKYKNKRVSIVAGMK